MAHETEAACLLRTGALFHRRAGLSLADGRLVFAGVKRGGFALYLGDDPYHHFDLDGRWQRALIDGTHYRKALDGSVDAIDRVRQGANLIIHRRRLPFAEVADLDEVHRSLALDLSAAVSRGDLGHVQPPPDAGAMTPSELSEMLDRIASWDADAWFRHRERFVATYAPLPFLPPDDLQSAVFQATVGNAGDVAFGGGTPVEHAVRTPEEFDRHCADVLDLLGRRIAQCRNAFLAGADVLHRPLSDILAYFDAIARHVPIIPGGRWSKDVPPDAPRLGAIDLFADDFRRGLPGRSALSALRERHLGRITLGVESGDAAVLYSCGKSPNAEGLIAFISDAKSVGVPLGVVLLVGAGGIEGYARHLAQTSLLLNSLPLGRGDLIYLVDASSIGDPTLSGRCRPLDPAALAAQEAAFKHRLAPLREDRGVKVVSYLREKEWN